MADDTPRVRGAAPQYAERRFGRKMSSISIDGELRTNVLRDAGAGRRQPDCKKTQGTPQEILGSQKGKHRRCPMAASTTGPNAVNKTK